MLNAPAIHGFTRAIVLTVLVWLAACGPSGPYTPPEGSPEREAIFVAMRQNRPIPDQSFVVRDMKVKGDWAWVTADPRSTDGTQHYETESWLLQRMGSAWAVVAQPCAEEGCTLKDEIAKIRARYPQAPAEIFPEI